MTYYTLMAKSKGKKRFRKIWAGFEKQTVDKLAEYCKQIDIESKIIEEKCK